MEEHINHYKYEKNSITQNNQRALEMRLHNFVWFQ